jgi:RimJ/RimL family protein N-acetyltransferase
MNPNFLISYRNIDHNSETDLILLTKWDNDPAIRHLSLTFSDEGSSLKLVTIGDVKKRLIGSGDKNQFTRFLILMDEVPVGDICFCIDFDGGIIKVPHTAWLGITIGEAFARGKGIGKMAMSYLEQAAVHAGAERFELGVFEFNDVALKLYKSIGYKEVGRLPNFTYWNGKMWSDIRLLKEAD